MEDGNTDRIVHPEKAEENMVPSGNLARTPTTWTVTRESEAQVGFVRDQAGTTCVEYAFQ